MNYIRTEENGQLVFEQSTDFLHIPSCLFGFHNTETIVGKAASGRTVYCFQGNLDLSESERRCKKNFYEVFPKNKDDLPACSGKRFSLHFRANLT